jgi:hypothetical protein
MSAQASDTVKFRVIMRVYQTPQGPMLIDGPYLPPSFEIIEEKPDAGNNTNT